MRKALLLLVTVVTLSGASIGIGLGEYLSGWDDTIVVETGSGPVKGQTTWAAPSSAPAVEGVQPLSRT
ncbi:hypothetical protein GCM10018965_031440 [Nonomuraea roseola]